MTERPPLADAVRLAFGTLTAIRVPAPARVDPGVAAAAMLLAPIAALPFAALVLLAHLALAAGWLGSLLSSALLLAALALGSRGLHLDGLADTADGLAAGYDRERALQVMRRGDVGPAGVATVALALLVQAAAMAALLPTPGGTWLAAVAVLASRHTLAWLCRQGVPAARADGLGAAVVGTVPAAAAGAAGLVLVVVAAAAAAGLGSPWYAAAATVVAAVAAALLLARRAVRRFGGVTGDVLGAGVEVALAVALTVASALR